MSKPSGFDPRSDAARARTDGQVDDYPDEEWVEDEDDDSSDDLLVCPSCQAAVHEDTQQCPQCGDWITPVYPAARWKRFVWTVAAVLAIALILLLTLR